MDPIPIVSLQDGEEVQYVLQWPQDVEEGQPPLACRALVIMKRVGGLLLAVPVGFLSVEDLQTASSTSEDTLLGPHTVLTIPALRQSAETLLPAGADIDVQVVDASLEILQGLMRLSDFGGAEEGPMPFVEDALLSPDPTVLLQYTTEWVSVSGASRTAFYSAEEEPGEPTVAPKKAAIKAKAKRASTAQLTAESIQTMAKLLPTMAAQLAELSARQDQLHQQVADQSSRPPPRASQQPVSMTAQEFAGIMGAPPKTKNMNLPHPPPKRGLMLDSHLTAQEQAEEAEDPYQTSPLAAAMLEQSRALSALVAHLAGDPLIDSGSASSTSSRGAQGREKLQKELSLRAGSFFLTVMQNMYKRLKPAMPVPASIQELAATYISLVHYLERFGGYGSVRDLGMVQYALAYIVDMALREDIQGIREHLALLIVGIEQFAQDGRWDLAFLLTLLEDPPPQMWSYRHPAGAQSGRLRAFAPLCPQRWATISLAYLKEIDFIQNRKQDLAKKEAKAPQPAQPAPKKKGGKGKGKGSEQGAAGSQVDEA